jgi:hypothetical protein
MSDQLTYGDLTDVGDARPCSASILTRADGNRLSARFNSASGLTQAGAKYPANVATPAV